MSCLGDVQTEIVYKKQLALSANRIRKKISPPFNLRVVRDTNVILVWAYLSILLCAYHLA